MGKTFDILRDYQKEAALACIKQLLTEKEALLVLSTGLGKSKTSFALIEEFIERGHSVLFIVHKVQLVEQVLKDVRSLFSEEVGSICGSLEERDNVDTPLVVGSIQTLARRPPKKKFDLIVFDEAHRVDTKKGSQYMKFLATQDHEPMIFGMTATPYRANGGYIYGQNDSIWSKVTYQKGLLWAIENKWLVKPILKHTEQQFDTSKLKTSMGDFDIKQIEAMSLDVYKCSAQIEDALKKLDGRKKVLWHCTCIEHVELVCELLRCIGETCSPIHSKMSKAEQDKILHDFETDETTRHLVFVMIVSEGYDVPIADALILMRPTKSPVLYVQVVGRVLRLHANKKDALVLDYGQVVQNCGPLDDPYLRERSKRKLPKDPSHEMKFCPKCLEYMKKIDMLCPSCGHDFLAAMLAEQKDRLKNLTKKASSGVLLSNEEKKEIKKSGLVVAIDPSLTKAITKSSSVGNKYIRINYFVEDMQKTIYQYLTFGTNMFQVKNNYDKLAALTGLQPVELKRMSLGDITNYLNEKCLSKVKQVVLKEKKGGFNDGWTVVKTIENEIQKDAGNY